MKSIIAQRLKLARETKKLTQVDVYNQTGINNKTLSGYENDVSDPDLETLKILAELYEVTTDYLLNISDNPNRDSVKKTSEYEDELTIAASGLQKEFKDLSPHNRKLVADFIKMLANQEKRPAE